jgi:hypothetical protein
MKHKILMSLVLSLAFVFSANASLISLERFNLASNPGANLQSFWDAYTGTTEFVTISGDYSNLFRGSVNNNTIYKLTVDFSSDSAKNISLFAGLDAGYGAEAYINGISTLPKTNGLWWSNNWAGSQVISLNEIGATPGMNVLTFYWAENNNSGGNSFEIFEANIGRLALSEQSVLAAVPEPLTLTILALGLFGLGARRFKR